ncbi:MAG: ADP-ribosylation factor-like protein [Promethearchaeota archaeon]
MISPNFNAFEHKPIIKVVQLSIFSDKLGPLPKYCYPKNTPEKIQFNIAMKSISLMMGEFTYQEGVYKTKLQFIGILPFPDIDLIGLSIFFLITDENARGNAKAATITLLVDENHSDYLFHNMKSLRVILIEVANKFESNPNKNKIEEIMDDFVSNILHFDITDPSAIKYSKIYKFIFTGLDGVGKTAFLNILKDKYSELMSLTPTKGAHRSEQKILDTILVEWELGGQKTYRDSYFKNAEFYLAEIDILFYFIDIQDSKRMEESLSYLNQLLTTLESFREYPPVVIVFHKYDPDLRASPKNKDIQDLIRNYKYQIAEKHKNWETEFFESSIYDQWSIISTFSNSLNKIHPARTRLRKYLGEFCKKIKANACFLLMRNAIVLSDYTESAALGKFLETSHSYFYSIFLRLEELNLVKNDILKWNINNLFIILKKIKIKNLEYYILATFDEEPHLSGLDSYLKKLKRQISK